MSLTKDEARSILQGRGLRVTGPREAVLRVLSESENPLSHTQVLERLGETTWDPATIYRNLVKLRDAGVAAVVSRADGLDRYALAGGCDDGHHHAHFVCEDCGHVACLPDLTASISMDGPWSASIEGATVQLRGACPDCVRRSAKAS